MAGKPGQQFLTDFFMSFHHFVLLYLSEILPEKKWNFLVSLILILNFSSVCLFALCSGQFSNLFLTFGQHVFTSVTSLLISVFFFLKITSHSPLLNKEIYFSLTDL